MGAVTTNPVDRRRFLQAGTAAAFGLATAPALAETAQAAQQKKPKDPFGGFTVGIQSYTYREFKLEQCLVQCQKLALLTIEFYRGHVPLEATGAQIKAVRNLCQEYRVTPIAFGVERFTKDHNANQRIFEFARQLGVRYLSADPDPDSFDSLDRLVANFNIGIAIHPHGPQGKELHRWWSSEQILAAVKTHHRLIGTCLDTGHLIRCAQAGSGLGDSPHGRPQFWGPFEGP
jgi:inosose dehydratase